MPVQNTLKGITAMLFACAVFSCGDLMIKFLSTHHNPALIVGLRNGLTLLGIAAIFMPRMGRALFRTERTWLVLLRAVALSFASICNAVSLRYLQLGEAISIIFLAPFGVMILANLILGERVSPLGWLLAGLGFSGVLLITGPGAGLDPTGVSFAAGAALGTTVYNFLSRFLANSESTIVLQAVTAGVGLVIFAPVIVMDLGTTNFSPIDIGALAVLVMCFGTGHYLITRAFAYATPGALAPVNYVQLVFSAGLSYLVYDHIPAPVALVGMAIVVIAGTAAVLVQRRRLQDA